MWRGRLAIIVSIISLCVAIGLYSFELYEKIVEPNRTIRKDVYSKSNNTGGSVSIKNNSEVLDTEFLIWVPNPCTTSERIDDSSTIQNCVPKVLQDYRIQITLTFNQVLILIIGGGGNLLTLVSVPYAYFKYRSMFPYLWNSVTLLMLHLSLCDFLYIVIGVPTYIVVYIYGYFPSTEWMCWLLSSLRHLVAYADFLTQGAIAATRCLGMLKNRKRRDINAMTWNEKSYYITTVTCISTWVLSFVLISPGVFELTINGIDFGGFGYCEHYGMCNSITSEQVNKYGFKQIITSTEIIPNKEKGNFSPSGLIYTIAFFVPFITINICYIGLHFIVKKYVDNSIDLGEHQFDFCQLNKTLLILSIIYFVFVGSLIPVKWVTCFGVSKETEAILTLVGYNFYIWAYAVNVIIYIGTLRDFPKIYKLFSTDSKNAIFSSFKRCLRMLKSSATMTAGEVQPMKEVADLGLRSPIQQTSTL